MIAALDVQYSADGASVGCPEYLLHAWPQLPPHVKESIFTLVDAALSQRQGARNGSLHDQCSGRRFRKAAPVWCLRKVRRKRVLTPQILCVSAMRQKRTRGRAHGATVILSFERFGRIGMSASQTHAYRLMSKTCIEKCGGWHATAHSTSPVGSRTAGPFG